MPRSRKLLPRPCPQCHSQYGTLQLVVINNSNRDGDYRPFKRPYIILRVGHYEPQTYKKTRRRVSTKKGYGRVWHNFRLSYMMQPSVIYKDEEINLRNIFKHPDFEDKVSKTIHVGEGLIDDIRENGWQVENERAHWKNKPM